MEAYARGRRNSVSFDWDPRTHELWFTNHGRDYLGDDAPPDTPNHAPNAGLNFGYPYCHAGTILDPEFGRKRSCAEFAKPAQDIGPHVAALRLYTGRQFPAHVPQPDLHRRGWLPEALPQDRLSGHPRASRR